jgi:hypothetical protein
LEKSEHMIFMRGNTFFNKIFNSLTHFCCRLDKFLHKKFPFELTDLLRKNQRLVSFHTFGDIQFHGGTHKATCSQLVIKNISTVEQLLREQSTL